MSASHTMPHAHHEPAGLSAGWGSVAGFASAVVARIELRSVLMALGLLALLVVIGGLGLVNPIWVAPWRTIASRLVETGTTGLMIFAAVVIADEAIERGCRPVLTYAVAIVAAAAVGAVVGWEIRAAVGLHYVAHVYPLNPFFAHTHRLELFVIGVLLGGMATFVHVSRRTALAARRRQHEAERARALAARRTLESQLQALQARVEPMFLFATLERIGALYENDAAAAGSMLEDLIVYLRAALPHMRESASTLAQEVTLARSWLDIVGRTGAGGRIGVETDIADDAARARLPALVLLPLVQHAVAESSGTPLALRLSAHTDAARLEIVLQASNGAFVRGVAGQPLLEQIGERLSALHGGAARVVAEAAAEGGAGSVARITLPLEPGADA